MAHYVLNIDWFIIDFNKYLLNEFMSFTYWDFLTSRGVCPPHLHHPVSFTPAGMCAPPTPPPSRMTCV